MHDENVIEMTVKRLKSLLVFIITPILYCSAPVLNAQNHVADSLVARGDALRERYRFEEAIATYSLALEQLKDSLLTNQDSIFKINLNDKLMMAENGRNLTNFVYSPTVVASHMFSLEEFFLYYPLPEKSWRPSPNQLDTLSGTYAKAVYAPENGKTIYYSAEDNDGIRNIYRTELTDSIWSVPTLLNEQITSASNEIYPMLSPDGKFLYFASEGLYGVGGYDLYVSEWDESAGDWSVPMNMGFPFSSPANDFLHINTADGKYSIFASDRECPQDSVRIYVLEHDNMPVRKEMSHPESLMELSRLKPTSGIIEGQSISHLKSDIPENDDTRRYLDKMAEVRALRDSISSYEKNLAEAREMYSMIENATEKTKLAERILADEDHIPVFHKMLDVAIKQLQEIEMNFLFSGIVIDPDRLLAEAEREIVSDTTTFIFSRMKMGEKLTLDMEQPEPEVDYSFRILETSQIVEDNTLPKGIIYQIQILGTTRPAPIKSLKGLTPIFETVSTGGNRVGVFTKYNNVLSHLNTVKRLGFKSAFIVGFADGKEVNVKKARQLESERQKAATSLYQVVISPSEGNMDNMAMEGIRQQSAGKDIARSEENLIIGPYNNRSEAEKLTDFVKAMGYGDAKIETIQR